MSRRHWRLALLGLCWAVTPLCILDIRRRRSSGKHGV